MARWFFPMVRTSTAHLLRRWMIEMSHDSRARWDRTAARRAGRAEIEKAARIGQPEPARDRLRREVQTAVAASTTEGEFLGRLRAAGVMVRERYSDHNPGERTGYAVAWPGFRNRDGEPVWYGGAQLAPHLSPPNLPQHWAG